MSDNDKPCSKGNIVIVDDLTVNRKVVSRVAVDEWYARLKDLMPDGPVKEYLYDR